MSSWDWSRGDLRMLKEASFYFRLARGLVDIVRRPTLPNPEQVLRDQLAGRTEAFLRQVREFVFGDPRHPYHVMFQMAGCEFGDLEHSVRKLGLESTLAQLRSSGVYLLHDELKDKSPIVRQGRHIPGNSNSFLKPGQGGAWVSRTSGSRSAGTSTPHNVAYRVYRDCYDAMMAQEYGLADRDVVFLLPILPAPYPFSRATAMHRLNHPARRWFAVGGTIRDAAHYRAFSKLLVLESKLLGVRTPWPEYLPPNDFTPVVRYLESTLARGRGVNVWAVTSPAVRVASTAVEMGIRLEGVDFVVGGEALTDAKRRTVEQSGARVLPSYIVSEMGTVGLACQRMSGNCVHIFEDNFAVISVDRKAPLTEMVVPSLHFTTLLPMNPRLLINAEIDDTGIISETTCDCTFARIGFRKQIDQIWSFSKLTGYGTTLVGSDIVRVLEEVLPKRFGGAPTDFQLVETETGRQTRMILRVNPRLTDARTDEVRAVFLEEIRKMFGGTLTVRDWRHGDAFEVVREEPAITSAGKVLPLHLLGNRASHNTAVHAGGSE
jgi:hypothetical protein